jgi:hypothetical protein
MKLTLTAKTGSVWSDKDDFGNWWGWYEVTLWHNNHRYKTRIEFKGVKNHNDIVWQDEPISVEFDTDTKEITIL